MSNTAIAEQFTFPIGTHIATRREIRDTEAGLWLPFGSVGMIVESPEQSNLPYRIQFLDGSIQLLNRKDFSIRKHLRMESIRGLVIDPATLFDHIQYRCIVGSRAYGLADEDSDTDRRGFYLAPASIQWSLDGAPEQIENARDQEAYWELQKFLWLALKANPNILECLYTPLRETVTPLAEDLLNQREMFLSRMIYQTFNGYVLSQFKKLEQDLRTKGEPRWKHAMHLIRLLISGMTALREGEVTVDMSAYREVLLTIKAGNMKWSELNQWRLSLHSEFDSAYLQSKLPDLPDFARANAFLLKARRSAVS